MQNLGKEVISRPRIRIMSASMEDTPAHVHGGVSGVGGDVEGGAVPDVGADADADENARVAGTTSL